MSIVDQTQTQPKAPAHGDEHGSDVCRKEVVQVLPSNTVEDMDSNVERIVQWVKMVTGKS